MYHNLLVNIKNASRAKKETVQMPFSNFDFAVARFLLGAGFVAAVDKKNMGKKSYLEMKLRYRDGVSAFTDFRLISKPSRRFYIGYRDLQSVKQGYGLAAISTPEGVLSNNEARKKKVGGEYLFQVW